VLLGEKPVDELTFCNQAMLEQKNIKLICNTQVVTIDLVQQKIYCEDERSFVYDSLCIATGKSPRMLPLFENKKFSNLFNFYYKSDLEQIINYIDLCKPLTAVVIGAGLTGLEAADGLRARGMKVTLVEATPQLLPTLITKPASDFIIKKIEDAGATMITGEKIVAYEAQDDHVTGLQLSNGQMLRTSLVVCAIGARPNTQFLPKEIALQNGYCVVNEYMQSSVPGIYAAGDCCIIYDQLTKRMQPNALWSDAMQQGMHAAYGMAGVPKKYPGSVSIASSSFFGLKVAIAGPVMPEAHQRIEERGDDSHYHRLISNNDKLVGFMLIGNTNALSDYRRQLLSR